MSEPKITPLARRLAEENGIDWRALKGSGPEGTVVERDILSFLAKVMAGEIDLPPAPEEKDLPPPPEAIPDMSQAQAMLAKEGVSLTDIIPASEPTPTLETAEPEPFSFSAPERESFGFRAPEPVLKAEVAAPAFEAMAPAPEVKTPTLGDFEIDFDDLDLSAPADMDLGAAEMPTAMPDLEALPDPMHAEVVPPMHAEVVPPMPEEKLTWPEPPKPAEVNLGDWGEPEPVQAETPLPSWEPTPQAEAPAWEMSASEPTAAPSFPAWNEPSVPEVDSVPADLDSNLSNLETPTWQAEAPTPSWQPEPIPAWQPEPMPEPGFAAGTGFAAEPLAAQDTPAFEVPAEPEMPSFPTPEAVPMPDFASAMPAEVPPMPAEVAPPMHAEVVPPMPDLSTPAAGFAMGAAAMTAPVAPLRVQAWQRLVRVTPASEAAETLEQAWHRDVGLMPLLYRATEKALADLELPLRATKGVLFGEILKSYKATPAHTLRGTLEALEAAFEEGDGLTVLDLQGFDQLIFPGAKVLSLGHSLGDQALLSVSGDMEPQVAGKLLERVAYYLERPILLA